MTRRPPRSTLFPYTARFRSHLGQLRGGNEDVVAAGLRHAVDHEMPATRAVIPEIVLGEVSSVHISRPEPNRCRNPCLAMAQTYAHVLDRADRCCIGRRPHRE